MKQNKLMVMAATFSAVVLGVAANGWCVGVDLLAGVTWTGVADNLVATATSVITAMVPVISLVVAIGLSIKVIRKFAR